MSKELILSGELLDRFKDKFGEEVEPSNFYCIKVRAISTEPLHQGTIFDGAVPTEQVIFDLSDEVNNTNNNVGVAIMHDHESLSVGRCFFSRVQDEGGVKSLILYMAILKTEETKSVIAKIENNVLDEVSVSFTAKEAKCNKCGFDYMSDEADMEHWFSMTCPEGHTIGKDGTHLILNGAEHFSETSIVNRGAANKPKILDNPKEQSYLLAASGGKPNKLVVCFEKMEKALMANEELVQSQATEEVVAPAVDLEEKVKDLETKLAEANAKLDLQEKIKEMEAKLAEKESQIADLEAKLAEKETELLSLKEGKDELESQLSSEKEESGKVMNFLREEVKKVLVASGSNNEEVPEDLNGISEVLGKGQQLLASLIPAGGVSAQFENKDSKKEAFFGEYSAEQLKAFQVK